MVFSNGVCSTFTAMSSRTLLLINVYVCVCVYIYIYIYICIYLYIYREREREIRGRELSVGRPMYHSTLSALN